MKRKKQTTKKEFLLYEVEMKERRRKWSTRERMVLLIPPVAAVCAVVIMLLVSKSGIGYEFEQAACQYYGGTAAQIQAGAKLTLNQDGETQLEQDGGKQVTSLPIYLSDKGKVVFPEDMLYYGPRSNLCQRLACFSELEYKANGTIVARREKGSVQLEQGFVYDGGDFYLFLEPVTVSFHGYTMELPALSYAEAVYGGYMMLFNYETKEFFMEPSDGTGTAQPASGDYVISLIGDSMTLYDGTKMLLETRPDLLDPMF